MGGGDKPDSEQVFLDLVAAWGSLPEDEEAVKEILSKQLAAERARVAEEIINDLYEILGIMDTHGLRIDVEKFHERIKSRYLHPTQPEEPTPACCVDYITSGRHRPGCPQKAEGTSWWQDGTKSDQP